MKMTKKQTNKIEKILHEFKLHKLHSGKPGPGKGKIVKNRKQAIAIALSTARKRTKK